MKERAGKKKIEDKLKTKPSQGIRNSQTNNESYSVQCNPIEAKSFGWLRISCKATSPTKGRKYTKLVFKSG